MKSKIVEPSFLEGLKAASYKSLLEKDLDNLKAEKEAQNFFIIPEHTFACKTKGLLMVIGLTTDWKSYLKDKLSTSSDNFVTGNCRLTNDSLAMEIERGKGKPAAIEKGFKSHVTLKKFKPVFTIQEDNSKAETTTTNTTTPTNNADLFNNIKAQVAEVKALDIKDEMHSDNDLRNILVELNDVMILVVEWEKKNPAQPKEDSTIAAQRKQIDTLKLGIQKQVDFVNNRLANKEFTTGFITDTADNIKKIAGFPTDDKAFTELLTAYEKLTAYIKVEQKEFDRLTDSTGKTPEFAKQDITMAHSFYTKIKTVEEAAQKYLQSSQKATYLLPASKKAAQQKQFAVQNMIMTLHIALKSAGEKLKINVEADLPDMKNATFEAGFKNAKENPALRAEFFNRFAQQDDFFPPMVSLLKVPSVVAALRDQLKMEVNVDPLDFTLAIFNKQHLNVTQAAVLYNDYIVSGSSKELNLPNKTRQACVDCFNSCNGSWQLIVSAGRWQKAIEGVLGTVLMDIKGEGWGRMRTRLASSETLQKVFLGL